MKNLHVKSTKMKTEKKTSTAVESLTQKANFRRWVFFKCPKFNPPPFYRLWSFFDTLWIFSMAPLCKVSYNCRGSPGKDT